MCFELFFAQSLGVRALFFAERTDREILECAWQGHQYSTDVCSVDWDAQMEDAWSSFETWRGTVSIVVNHSAESAVAIALSISETLGGLWIKLYSYRKASRISWLFSVSLCLSLWLSLSVFLTLSLSFWLSLSVSLYLSISISLYISLSLSISLYLSLSISQWIIN